MFNLVSWRNKGRIRLVCFLFSIKNDEEGLQIQMHLEEKNVRTVGWVGRLFGRIFSAELISIMFVAAESKKEKMV